jgi:hypothetical protein
VEACFVTLDLNSVVAVALLMIVLVVVDLIAVAVVVFIPIMVALITTMLPPLIPQGEVVVAAAVVEEAAAEGLVMDLLESLHLPHLLLVFLHPLVSVLTATQQQQQEWFLL